MIETHKATMRRADPGDCRNTRCRFVNGRVGADVRNPSEDGSMISIGKMMWMNRKSEEEGLIDFG